MRVMSSVHAVSQTSSFGSEQKQIHALMYIFLPVSFCKKKNRVMIRKLARVVIAPPHALPRISIGNRGVGSASKQPETVRVAATGMEAMQTQRVCFFIGHGSSIGKSNS